MSLIDSYPKTCIKEIENLESICKIQLPEEYKQFILRDNGGEPHHHDYDINGEYDGDISHFFGIRTYPATADLRTEWQEYRDRIPKNIFPIGASYGGDLICISLKLHEIGVVYRWDHEMASYDEEPVLDELTKLANNLNDFMGMLYTDN